MVYVKEVKRYDKAGSYKYSDYYLAEEVPTTNGKYTTKILGRATPEDRARYQERPKEVSRTEHMEHCQILREGAQAYHAIFTELFENPKVRPFLAAIARTHPEQITKIEQMEAFL